MTGEEMERAIEFLLKNQASFDARLEESKRQLDSYADTQAQLMQVVTRTFEVQNLINEDVRRWQAESRRDQEAAWAVIRELGVKQDRTEETVNRLAETVRRQIEGRDGNSGG